MFEFDFVKCSGMSTKYKPKFCIKYHNNGWHRFFSIIIPQKNNREYFNFVEYQITYWNNYKKLFKKKEPSTVDEPCETNDTQLV